MTGGEPEVGDKVSWNWGGGAPGGTVADIKTKGEIAIKSKRGNTIKKNASKDNPGVHISRSGNDVVKRVSELNVTNKGGGGKRKHEDEEAEKEDEIEKNDDGKDVRSGGKKAKKEEADDAKPKANEKKKAGRPKGAAGGAAKEKKASKPRNTEGVSGRTRSQKK